MAELTQAHGQRTFSRRTLLSKGIQPCASLSQEPAPTPTDRNTSISSLEATATATLTALATVTAGKPAHGSDAWEGIAPVTDPDQSTTYEFLSHLLRRSTFGIAPGDLEYMANLGWEAWLDEQLNPQRINDSTTETAINTLFPTLGYTPREMIDLDYSEGNQGTIARSARGATLYRAINSQRQLQEVMVDFWTNHFNINLNDGVNRVLKAVDDRDVIRPNALGNFRNLLHASAKSPSMLFYLDNNVNVADGPNENYARELMELHTLGVDGGYSQEDVAEVARCFTGWAFDNRRDVGTFEFLFRTRTHDSNAKTVLGTTIPAGGGIVDGEAVLDMLAAHPSTANFIATKLCRRFIADEPQENTITAVANAFSTGNGDISTTLWTLFHTSEFLTSAGQKFKRPLDFLVSALRASTPLINDQLYSRKLANTLNQMGQGIFARITPDGYPDEQSAWDSSSSLMDRWNLAMQLAENRVQGIQVDHAELRGNGETNLEILTNVASQLLPGIKIPATEQNAVLAHMATVNDGNNQAPTVKTAMAAGLLLCTPEFQLR